MNRSILQPGSLLAFTALLLPASLQGQTSGRTRPDGSVSGLIRDAEGVPQMGALVEALLPDATVGASALTDSRGQYRFLLQPGSYRIRATASLLMPGVRERLLVASGTRTVVDFTLSTILAPGGWLPVSRRTGSEPADDWMWTLRSSASRSILRLTQPDEEQGTELTGGVVAISSSRQESRQGATNGRLTFKDSDGGFGRGGSHQIVVLTRAGENGEGAVLRADLSGSRSPFPVAPSTDISVGLQRGTSLNGYSRAVLTYSSHPELLDNRGMNGLQGVVLRSGQRLQLGDLVRVDVGSVMRNGNLHGNAFVAEPFLRLALRPGAQVELAYTVTRARGTESLDDLDRVQAALPIAVLRNNHLQFETATHHALSAATKVPGGGTAELVLYHDSLQSPLLSGVGHLSDADLHTDGLIADPTTRTYRVAARDYSSGGVRVSYRMPVTRALQMGAEFSTGNALRASHAKQPSMTDVLGGLHSSSAYAATAHLDGKLLMTGTTLRASYRWQPLHTLTAVDSFRVVDEGAYLSCSLRQSLGKLGFLPRQLEALVDVQNLLAQGYQPFVSSDGQTLYLAQTPRTLQAGVSFSF